VNEQVVSSLLSSLRDEVNLVLGNFEMLLNKLVSDLLAADLED